MNHELKIEEKFFKRLTAGLKTFEIRLNDRDFQVNDTITFIITPFGAKHDYSYPENHYLITYIYSGYGLEEGFCILSIRPYSV